MSSNPAEGISFSVADIPADVAPTDNLGYESDLSCEVCGTALEYAGRGRKPRYCAEHKKGSSSSSSSTRASSSGRRSTRDVDAAMASLDAAHTSLSFGLMLLSPNAAAAWSASLPDLKTRNQMILESDPALAKRIASMAAKGGGTALMLNHLIAVAPVLGIVRGDMRERRAAKRDAGYQDVPLDAEGATIFDMAGH